MFTFKHTDLDYNDEIERRNILGNAIKCVLHKLYGSAPTKVYEINEFSLETMPVISIDKFYDRILRYTGCSSEALIMSCILIDRLHAYCPKLPVYSLTIHKLILTATLIAAKLVDDEHRNNERYAKIGGIEIQEMNNLELKFLSSTNFDLLCGHSKYKGTLYLLCNNEVHLPNCDCDFKNLNYNYIFGGRLYENWTCTVIYHPYVNDDK